MNQNGCGPKLACPSTHPVRSPPPKVRESRPSQGQPPEPLGKPNGSEHLAEAGQEVIEVASVLRPTTTIHHRATLMASKDCFASRLQLHLRVPPLVWCWTLDFGLQTSGGLPLSTAACLVMDFGLWPHFSLSLLQSSDAPRLWGAPAPVAWSELPWGARLAVAPRPPPTPSRYHPWQPVPGAGCSCPNL